MNYIEELKERLAGKGLVVRRYFTSAGTDPLGEVVYDKRSSSIKNPDGTVVFEMHDIEVPKAWSQIATDIIASKYFRKKGVPQPDSQGNVIREADGNPRLGAEQSVRQVVTRMSRCWRHWGQRYGYFRTAEDADAFEDELKYMLVNQFAAPNSPQWFNSGIQLVYGINGPAQGHYYVDPDTRRLMKSEDAYSRPQVHACFIQSLSDDLVNEGGIFDLLTREARIFKYGSGTGSNFSALRGEGEPLSGGGVSSGLMSFLKIFDRAAGAIKSGGTTRRAAKMVCLNIDHPDIEKFVDWKMLEEQKVAVMVAGSRNLKLTLSRIHSIAAKNPSLRENSELRDAVRDAARMSVPMAYIKRVIQLASQGQQLNIREFNTHYESDAYATVSGQNSNNSVRVSNKFMDALAAGNDWNLLRRTDGKVAKTVNAQDLWRRMAYASWSCSDPGLQFDDTINEWHTCPADGRINASNPCSEFMFLDDTACNLASINLSKFFDDGSGRFDIDGYRHAIRIWTIVLEISVLMAQYPSKETAENSYIYRALGLGYANLGSLLMRMGIPYDSEKGRAVSAALTAVLTGESYATSAEMARHLGAFEGYKSNAHHMLRVVRNHRRAAYHVEPSEYEGLTVIPPGLDQAYCPDELLGAAREAWDKALELGSEYGFRNAQVSVTAPTGTIGLVMDCDTTGIEPDYALVKFKKLAGGGYFKVVNLSVAPALRNLGYAEGQINDILAYCVGTGMLANSPYINRETLLAKGVPADAIARVEKELKAAFHLKFVFNKYVLGGQVFASLFPGKGDDLDVLTALGFTREQIELANRHVCGTMTIEGAPHLLPDHYAVFDCASKCGSTGKRYIHHMGHVRMMSAVQQFITGAISKTINMPNEATVEEIERTHFESWKLMLKAIAIYRDGSKLSQPLNVTVDEDLLLLESAGSIPEAAPVSVSAAAQTQTLMVGSLESGVRNVHQALDPKPQTLMSQPQPLELQQPAEPQAQPVQSLPKQALPVLSSQPKMTRVKLPAKRRGFVQEASIAGHKIYLRTGEYEDGKLGEIFVDMYKEGSGYRSLLNCFAVVVSKALQYGVPLEEFVDSFTFTRFEPAGPVSGHAHIKNSTSILDYVFRVLGYEYLGRTDFLHVVPNKNGNGPASAGGKIDQLNIYSKQPRQDQQPSQQQTLPLQPQSTGAAGQQQAAPESRQVQATERIFEAKSRGYTGDQCGACGSMCVKKNGSCSVCEECGVTTGCS